MAYNSNKKLVPEAMTALDRFKYEVASEVGVNLKNGYNGDFCGVKCKTAEQMSAVFSAACENEIEEKKPT